MSQNFNVIEKNGWFYVLDEDGCEFPYSGPWRYRHDAEEYADELNAPLNLADGCERETP